LKLHLDGLITVDPMMAITDVNETMCRMSATRARRTDRLLRIPEYFVDSKRASEGVRLTLDKGAAHQLRVDPAEEKEQTAKAWLIFNAQSLQDQFRRGCAIFASARDITDQARLQSQLAEERASTIAA